MHNSRYCCATRDGISNHSSIATSGNRRRTKFLQCAGSNRFQHHWRSLQFAAREHHSGISRSEKVFLRSLVSEQFFFYIQSFMQPYSHSISYPPSEQPAQAPGRPPATSYAPSEANTTRHQPHRMTHQQLHFTLSEGLLHSLHQSFQIMLHILHHYTYLVHVFLSEVWTRYDIEQWKKKFHSSR